MKHGLFFLSALLASAPSLAGDVLDTRITFSIADNDLLKGPEDSAVGSPSIPNFQPNNSNRLFFDDFERRDIGFENLSHLVLYTNQPGFLAGIDTEAALVMRASVTQDGEVILRDDGSYIRIAGALKVGEWSLTAFPISANRFQLGYSFDLAWGGSAIFQNVRAAPGFKFQYTNEIAYAFLGAKTGLGKLAKSDGTIEQDTVYGVLAGGGFNILDELKLEFNGGYFHRGTIDKQELRQTINGQVETARWDAVGGSAQITYAVGEDIPTPVDFRLYRNDPLRQSDFFRVRDYQPGISFLIRSEASFLGQTLQDPQRPNSTVIQPAIAADLTFQAKFNKIGVHALAVYRDLAYILFNVPSEPSFVNFQDGQDVRPEFFAKVGIDYLFEKIRFTPGLILGVQLPAHMTSTVSAGANPPTGVGQQTIVFRNAVDRILLDPGDAVLPVFGTKATFKFDLSKAIVAAGEFQFSYDPNRRGFLQDDRGIVVRVADDPVILGFTLQLRARF